jgi:hypothetical protein
MIGLSFGVASPRNRSYPVVVVVGGVHHHHHDDGWMIMTMIMILFYTADASFGEAAQEQSQTRVIL